MGDEKLSKGVNFGLKGKAAASAVFASEEHNEDNGEVDFVTALEGNSIKR